MKKPALLLILVLAISSMQAQLLLDSRTFFAEGASGVAAWGKIEFWQDAVGSDKGTLKLTLANLSVHTDLEGDLTGYENGVLTAFGFNVGSGFSYVGSSFTETVLGPVAGLRSGFEPYGIDFIRDQGNVTVGQEVFQASAHAANPAPREGLSGGYGAQFAFRYDAANAAWVESKFNATHFFADTDQKDLYLRFQSVSNDGCGDGWSDKVFVSFPDEIPPTPEPATYGMMGAGVLLGAAVWRRRQKQKTVAA